MFFLPSSGRIGFFTPAMIAVAVACCLSRRWAGRICVSLLLGSIDVAVLYLSFLRQKLDVLI